MIEIFELPLFPLNTVLFPGMYLPLHIFEPRYKEMIRLCLDEKRPFGVVYIQDGQAEGGPLPEPHTVGCTAHIMQMQPLEDGRMNIMTIGRDRFRVLAVERERPYLVGQVERIPLQADGDLASLADRLYPQVLQYLQQLARLGKLEFDADQIPTDPETLAYLAAAVLQVPTAEKQTFLTANPASQLYRRLLTRYRQENGLLHRLQEPDEGSFSLN